MNIQQREDVAAPATNVTALRARRNILANSDVGVMVLNKEVDGPTYNRLAGADANFRFFQNLNVNGMLAKTVSPDASSARAAATPSAAAPLPTAAIDSRRGPLTRLSARASTTSSASSRGPTSAGPTATSGCTSGRNACRAGCVKPFRITRW